MCWRSSSKVVMALSSMPDTYGCRRPASDRGIAF
jgi:hypothetical protein